MTFFARLAVAAVALLLTAASAHAEIKITTVKSPGGIEAWLVEERGLPIISIAAGFDGGSRLDPVGKEGLAYLVSTLMNEGAGDLDSAAYAAALQDRAIYFGGSAGSDDFGLSLTTLSANKDEAFRLMKLAIEQPRFDEEAIARMKAQIAASIRAQDEDPESIANLVWAERAFAGHPYGRRAIGTDASLAAITRADIQGFMTSALGRDKLDIVVVGDISAEELAPLLDHLFGALPPARALAASPPAVLAKAGAFDVIDRDIPQSVIVFGAEGVGVSDPDFRAAQIMNWVLGGGGFRSRLMNEVRVKRGATYGIYTWMSTRKDGAFLYGAFSADKSKAKEAIEVVQAEIQRMREGGISDAELDEAKAFLTGSYALNFDSNGKLAGNLLGLKQDGFDSDYVNRRNDLVRNVTRDDVARAAQRLLDPAKFYMVTVGRPAGM